MVVSQYFKIDVFSHHFTLTQVQPRGREVAESFAKQYIQYGLVKEGRRFVRAPVKVFAVRVRGFSEFRFHIEQFEEFMRHLTNLQILPHTYEIVTHVVHPGMDVALPVLESWTAKDYQLPIIDYLVSDKPTTKKLVEIQTGKGKTFSAAAAMSVIGKRVLIVIRPMYIDKWVEDLEKIYGISGADVIVVQGSAQLMHLITNAKMDRLKAKAIIISNKTLQNWYMLYEKKGNYIDDLGYDCRPGELMPVLNVGCRLIDEVHQDFHLNFKIDLYSHVARSISLSATLRGDDPFLNRMYEVAYPKPMRYAGMIYDRYVDAYSWIFQVDRPDQIRTVEWGSTTYSHHAFEKSIMRNKALLDDYLDMIVNAAMRIHFERYEKGDRLLIYCASIQMCGLVTEHLKAAMEGIDIRRYVEDDPYENLMNADVSVSTLLSAGTGHDIAGLTSVILTTAISSSQSNIQGFGRLRKLPNRKLRFAYFVCSNIPKHLEYHLKKKDLLTQIALSYDSISYAHHLGR